jgi:hypothetical protein
VDDTDGVLALLVSELVTNAVSRARSTALVRLAVAAGAVELAVADQAHPAALLRSGVVTSLLGIQGRTALQGPEGSRPYGVSGPWGSGIIRRVMIRLLVAVSRREIMP